MPTRPLTRPTASPVPPILAVLVISVLTLMVTPALLARAAPASGATPADTPAETGAEVADFATIAALDELTDDHARLFRLYWAFFHRSPDPAGALYWVEQHDNCLGLDAIAEWFLAGREFERRYGPLDDEGFVEQIYRNVLGRPADGQGLAYWTGLLDEGRLTRGGVVLNVSLSDEFTRNHPYPSDGVPPRSCRLPDGRATNRSVHVLAAPAASPLATVAGLTIAAPSGVIERAGFHQSTHPGALAMIAADDAPVRTSVLASRGRGTARTGAVDIVVEPATGIVAPVSGTVARAGDYTLYCRYRDGYVVINPDGRPDLEVKLLHIRGVSVRAGQRVEVGDAVAAHATTFPFSSQVDALTAEPSWPHVHIEVVDPSVPRKSSGGC
jgi:hypothetical protein